VLVVGRGVGVEVRKLDIVLLGDEYQTSCCCCCCAVVTFEGATGPRRSGHADRYTLASVSVGESGGVAVPKRFLLRTAVASASVYAYAKDTKA
jgi:hypothetical protein